MHQWSLLDLFFSDFFFVFFYSLNNSFFPNLLCSSVKVLIIILIRTLKQKCKSIDNLSSFDTRLLLTFYKCFLFWHFPFSKCLIFILIFTINILQPSIIHSKMNILLRLFKIILSISSIRLYF